MTTYYGQFVNAVKKSSKRTLGFPEKKRVEVVPYSIIVRARLIRNSRQKNRTL